MQQIDTLVGLTDDELLQRLGRVIWEQSSHANPATPRSLTSEAKQWLKENLPKARSNICGNPIVDALRKKSDEIALIGAIADVFTKSLGFPVPAIVAILTVRIGLDRLCNEKKSLDS
jgi:hypothetical protein